MKILGTLLTASCLATGLHAANFTNPLKSPLGSDPHIVYVDGYYYLTTTTYENIQITRATTLGGLKTGENKIIWTPDDPSRSCDLWAPEMHQVDGVWHLYFTAGTCGNCCDNQKAQVLEGGASPWDDYRFLATLTPNEFGIDGTVLTINNQNYFVWSCITSDLQGLCIATLDTPGSIGPRHELSLPLESWEVDGFGVNEGPAPLYHDGKTFLAFSASYCGTASYQLGLLTYEGGDPLEKSSWTKTGPLFSSANGNYGTAHNGFFNSPDGTETWNVYHATSISTGHCGRERYTMARSVAWGADGQPIFGQAETLGTQLVGPSGEPA
ncbi:hypothetical protein J7T55_007920 [Diaporthe amygdali]|uniref:uncharacterized protein n=1 Tax=Phomopsis amygdali TaxID=1214568 RepID=UPI0022FE78A8|nr:uncharacterized protein J7T55_007920 [Diaporthe amygdali]KAJ0114086.1 hypothetical protein J7T55_007920 [Diaporthe amygdali]